MRKVIETVIINKKKYSIFIVICVLLGVISLLGSIFLFHNFIVGVVLFIAIILLLSIVEKKIRKKYSKNCSLSFDSSGVEINTASGENIYFDCTNIKFFRIQISSRDDSLFLKFICRDNNKRSYTFINQKGGVSENSISVSLFHCINNYNSTANENAKITLLPNFFVTGVGKFLVGLLSLTIVLIIVLLIYKKSVYWPTLLLPGLSLYIIIIIQQRYDKEQAKMMEK